MARTKIICTLGPSTRDEKTIAALAASGMDVARINFSHGTYEEKLDVIASVRKVSSETGNPIAILGDLCGPKIRIGELEQEKESLISFVGSTRSIWSAIPKKAIRTRCFSSRRQTTACGAHCCKSLNLMCWKATCSRNRSAN